MIADWLSEGTEA